MPPQPPVAKKEDELEKKLKEIKLKQEDERYAEMAQRFGIPFSTLKGVPIDTEALNLLTEEDARKSNLAVLYKSGKKIIVALTDPENAETKKTLSAFESQGFTLSTLFVSPSTLNTVWQRYKTIKQKVFKIGAIEINEEELTQLQEQIKDLSDLKNKLQNISVTKLLEILIAGALKTKASDMHFEPEHETARIRYRLDGILHDITNLDVDFYEKILNRIKVLSKMKLNIHDSPQDGRFTIKQRNLDIEVRVSIIPSEFGETIVMRLLDPRSIKVELEDLGIRKDLLETIQQQLKKKTGAIMVSGPTGAGKTTTLYAFANRLNEPGTKIITIEDPIEYHVKNISQTQVNPKKGYTFANGLRSIVRQDPDIILVGEIRDVETAEIALHAALTGHFVLSTIHTNDAAGVIPRLVDLGIRTQIIAPAINITIAQRLVRRLCTKCKKQEKVKPEDLEKIKKILIPIKERFNLPALDPSLKIYYAGRCNECNMSGYEGRVGVFEIFVVSKAMEQLILTSPPISQIQELAVSEGMTTLIQDVYLKVLDGLTSIEEIERAM